MEPAAPVTAPPLAQPLPFRLLLDEAVHHARRHFRRIFPAVAIPMTLAGALLPIAQGLMLRGTFAGGGRAPDPSEMLVGFGAFAGAMLLFWAAYGLGYGALLAAAIDALAGREVSMARAWRLMLRPKIFGTLLLTALAVGVGFLFCILPGIYAGLLFSLTVPVMVEEGVFGPSAMGRSADLARYNPQRQFDDDPRFKVFIIVLVGTLLGYMVNLLIQLPVIVVQQLMMFRDVAGGQRTDPAEMMQRMTWMQVPTTMLSMLTNTAVNLYVCFGVGLLFFDVKGRKEGLDLEAAIGRLAEAHLARPRA